MNNNTRDKEYRERVRLLLAQGLGAKQIARETCRLKSYVDRIRDEMEREVRKAEEMTEEAA